jgi:F-type H+-transporting ATPase subunit gamma
VQKLIDLKRRIRTVENIRAVTRTLATVSSAKLSRTRARAAGTRLYADRMREALARQQRHIAASGVDPSTVSPFLEARGPVTDVLLVHLAGDRGMCGSYNMAVNRLSAAFVRERVALGQHVSVAVKGIKGERYLRRKTSADVVHAEGWSRAGVQDDDVDRLQALVTKAFVSGEAQEVYAAYTRFFTPLRRESKVVRLLPLDHVGAPPEGARSELWSYEPGFEDVMGELFGVFVRLQVEDILLQSYASEQGARMITMEEATERATKTLHECRLLHNRLRREAITTDLLGVLFASRLREHEEAERQAV